MKIISHRGNLNGPNPDQENRPEYIDAAIAAGYDVEIDLYYVRWEGSCDYVHYSYHLGHDLPLYEVDLDWLRSRRDNLWIHCKNIEACIQLNYLDEKFQFFAHQEDDVVLTSTGYVWVHNLSLPISDSCIIPLIDKEQLAQRHRYNPYAICTDYPNE